jgi:hypothetical protein
MSVVVPPVFEDEASLFSLATEYLEAADILIQAPVVKLNVSLVTYYLLGHASELLLKSFLVKHGVSLKDLKCKFGHNLAKLIQRARELGLPESVSLTALQELSKNYTPKDTEYRQLVAATYPSRDRLLNELRVLESQVFNHVGRFTSGV